MHLKLFHAHFIINFVAAEKMYAGRKKTIRQLIFARMWVWNAFKGLDYVNVLSSSFQTIWVLPAWAESIWKRRNFLRRNLSTKFLKHPTSNSTCGKHAFQFSIFFFVLFFSLSIYSSFDARNHSLHCKLMAVRECGALHG